MERKARITLPVRFLRSDDRIDRRLTVSMTVRSIRSARSCWPYRPYVFFALEQKFRTVRLTVETVATDRKDRIGADRGDRRGRTS